MDISAEDKFVQREREGERDASFQCFLWWFVQLFRKCLTKKKPILSLLSED